jgi:HlyD family secretion protein
MKKLIILIAIVSAVSALVIWKKVNSGHQSLLVNSELVTEQILSDSILASGNLIFNTQIQIRSEVTGIVTQVLVEEGETVDKGQILMQLDQTSFAADVANNQAAVNAQKIEIEFLSAQHNELRRQFTVKEKLYAQKLVGFDDLEQFKSQMHVSTIKIKAAKERLNQNLATLTFAQDRLSKTTFRATMPGLIAAVDVKPGETVIAGTTNIIGSALMTLADPTTILAELRVDEADIASVKPGMTVEVFAAANPKQALNGDVISIGTSARSSRQGLGLYFRVKALIKDNQQLYPGMSCRAEIITAQSENSLNVPISSIRKEQDKYYVWVMANNKASKHYVEVGMATDTQQQLISGVTKGQTVVTGPSRVMQDIKEGSTLREKQGS